MYKVRFNLGKGKRYMTWKVTKPNGEVDYLNPKEVFLRLDDCTLKNNKKSALDIFNGANKRVCAFVTCKNVEVCVKVTYQVGDKISYNPRVKPYWVNSLGEDIDNLKIKSMVSEGYSLYKV
jgi:hypothetical protein